MISRAFLSKIDAELRSRSERRRWQAAIALGEFVESEPERIWPVVLEHGSRRRADVRMAIATCVLEHMLQYHFDAFLPRAADTARRNRWFRDTVQSCWLMGQANTPANARRWKRLERQLREIDAKEKAE
jgi:hypothetical protein